MVQSVNVMINLLAKMAIIWVHKNRIALSDLLLIAEFIVLYKKHPIKYKDVKTPPSSGGPASM